jgi:hypothetical protein
MLMEASHSTIAQKFYVSEAVRDVIVWNSGAGEALQNTLVQISGVEAFQDIAAQNTHAVEML